MRTTDTVSIRALTLASVAFGSLVVGCSGSATAPANRGTMTTPANTAQDASITLLIARVTQKQATDMEAFHPPEFDDVTRGDLDTDGDSDAALLYTIEGMKGTNDLGAVPRHS